MKFNLKAWLIKKLGGVALPPVVPAATKRINVKALQRAIDQADTVDKPAFRKYAAPSLPPGVIPENTTAGVILAHDEAPRRGMAFDDGGSTAPSYLWLNQFSGVGAGLGFPGYPYLAELTQISEYRAPSETISTEMTRKWLKFITKGKGDKSDKIEKIEAAFTEFNVRDLFKRAAMMDGEFGRAQIILNIKGQDGPEKRQLPLEVDKESIGVGALESMTVIEPYWSTPYSWESTHPERSDFYIPQSWYIMGRKTHTSRFLTFIAREVPDLLKPAYNFGGISMTQLMEPYVNMWLRTRKSVNDLINIYSITILATQLSSTLEEGSDGSAMLNRATLFTKARSNRGLALIDKETEEIGQVNTPLSGLDKLQAQSQEHMAAPCHIPLVKLFGVVPTGLNATSEGEIQVWYDFVRAMQENLFGPQLDKLLKVIQLHLFGDIDEEIGYEWVSLDEPTPAEAAATRKSDADAGASYIASGVVAPEEERERLQNDPNSGYDNLSGPAPELPQEMDENGNPTMGINPQPDGDGDDPDGGGEDMGKFSLDAAFEESKHPRGHGGKFGSGGDPHRAETSVVVHKEYTYGGPPDDEGHENPAGKLDPAKIKASQEGAEKVNSMTRGSYEPTKAVAASENSARATQGGMSKAPFVNAFMKDHKNREDDMARLGKTPDEKLKQALKLLTGNRVDDEDAKYMKELIRDVLKTSGKQASDAAFTESQHPRGTGGQFTESGAGSESNKPMKTRKYPSYTLEQLEQAVAEGNGTPMMIEEIANRKDGSSTVKITPQILGGKAQVKLGRM